MSIHYALCMFNQKKNFVCLVFNNFIINIVKYNYTNAVF